MFKLTAALFVAALMFGFTANADAHKLAQSEARGAAAQLVSDWRAAAPSDVWSAGWVDACERRSSRLVRCDANVSGLRWRAETRPLADGRWTHYWNWQCWRSVSALARGGEKITHRIGQPRCGWLS